jgi:cytidylate kinase
MDNFVITIARQYGSGGRTIGEELAKKLGISYYDKDIIRMASEESGIHEQLFGRADENVSTKQRFFAKSGIYKGELIPPQSKDFTSDENLFNYQAKIIRQLAETESCVIIGRCANMILKDYSNDKRKEDFCKRFMGVDWADMTKYNLCLDNGTLGYKKCVEEIESALEILKK